MKEGTKEKEVMRVVYCKGFKKLLDLRDCNAERCKYHGGIQKEPIKQREGGEMKVIGYDERVICMTPHLEKIMPVAGVED